MAAVLCVVCFAALPAAAWANWHEPGGPLNVDATKSAAFPRIASVGWVPYVAWEEQDGAASQIRVAALSGGTWQLVGGPLNANAGEDAESPAIADIGGVPYVAWAESNGTNWQIHVAALNGSNWQLVGGVLNADSTKDAAYPSLVSVGGVPYVTWKEYNGTNDQVRVAKLNGSSWQLVGGALYADSTKAAESPTITSVGGVPYVAWEESNGTNWQIHVAALNGSNWQPVGGTLNKDPASDALAPMVASVGGVPYVVWYEGDGTNEQIYVAALNGGNWQLVGSAVNGSLSSRGSNPSISSVGGVPYVAWEEGNGTSDQVRVAMLSGSNWREVGGPLNDDAAKPGFSPSLVTIGGVPYVTWYEEDSASEVRAARLEPDLLSETATPSVSGALLSAQVNDYGVPLLMAFQYGTSQGFGSQTQFQLTSGGGLATITQQVNGLAPDQTYFYRALGSDSFRQTSAGATMSFTTLPLPPPAPASAGSPPLDQISNLKITPSSFRAAAGGPSATPPRASKTGATVSYTDSGPAATTLTIQLAGSGRVQGKSCVNPSKKNRSHKRCTRYLNLGSFTRQDAKGANRFRLTGRINGRKLSPGSYRLQAIPRDGAGAGSTVSANFRIEK